MKKHIISIFILFAVGTLFSPKAKADIKIIKGTFERGMAECRNGKYSKGIDTIIDGAMDLRREAPKHILNTQWRVKLRFCINRWSDGELTSCKKKHLISSYENLLKVEKKSSIIASSFIKKSIKKKISNCFYSLKNHYKKTCKKDKDVISEINKLKKIVSSNKKFTKSIVGVMGKCLETQWKSTLKECSKTKSIPMLKRVFVIRKLLPKSKKINGEYKKCLVEQMTGGRELCRLRKYSAGKKLVSKSLYLIKNMKIKDNKAIKNGKKWKQECGFYRLTLSVVMKAVSGGIAFHLPGKTELIVASSRDGKSVTACGEIKFESPRLKSGKCSTLATASTKSGKGFLVCLKGTITKKKSSKYSILDLKLDPKVVRSPITETVQHFCKGKQPIVFKAKLFENLFKKSRLRVKIKAHAAESQRFRIPMELVGGRKAIFLGSWTLHYN